MFQAIYLGVLEGLTEFLPISSTGHLLLVQYFTGIDLSSQSVKVFTISVQLGAILAVVVYYLRDLLKLETIKLLVVSVLPTLVLGLLLNKVIDAALSMPILIAVNLILGGVIILYAESVYKKKLAEKDTLNEKIGYREGAVFGLVQSIAMIPGVSRSGAIIIFGLYKGFSREMLTKFTFLLAVPTMSAATGYVILKNYKSILAQGSYSDLIFGFVSAFLTALVVVRYALPYVRKYSFTPFGWYRIILGALVLVVLL